MPIYTNPFRVIYKITNHITNKVYIGSTVNVVARHNTHTRNLIDNKHHNIKLQNAWNKYGAKSFSFQIIEIVDGDLLIRERFYVDQYDSVKYGYNIVYPEIRMSGNSISYEERAKQRKEYDQNNKELISVWHKKYKDNNKELISTQNKDYYQKNKELMNNKTKEYRNNNRDKINARRRVLAKIKKNYLPYDNILLA